MTAFSHVPDLVKSIELPTDGTLSRTIYQDERIKVILFGFSAGQELSEHTASSPAILHFLQGEAALTLGSEQVDATAGTWVHMQAQLPHSIRTRTPVAMLLSLLKSG